MFLSIVKLLIGYTGRAEIWSRRGASHIEWLSIKVKNKKKILPNL